MIALITWKSFAVAMLFTGAFLLCCIIFASFKVNNPRWYYCVKCGCYHNDLGTQQVAPPPNVDMSDIEPEGKCCFCITLEEAQQKKARQHHNCCQP